jgi:hypothetical protein
MLSKLIDGTTRRRVVDYSLVSQGYSTGRTAVAAGAYGLAELFVGRLSDVDGTDARIAAWLSSVRQADSSC